MNLYGFPLNKGLMVKRAIDDKDMQTLDFILDRENEIWNSRNKIKAHSYDFLYEDWLCLSGSKNKNVRMSFSLYLVMKGYCETDIESFVRIYDILMRHGYHFDFVESIETGVDVLDVTPIGIYMSIYDIGHVNSVFKGFLHMLNGGTNAKCIRHCTLRNILALSNAQNIESALFHLYVYGYKKQNIAYLHKLIIDEIFRRRSIRDCVSHDFSVFIGSIKSILFIDFEDVIGRYLKSTTNVVDMQKTILYLFPSIQTLNDAYEHYLYKNNCMYDFGYVRALNCLERNGASRHAGVN